MPLKSINHDALLALNNVQAATIDLGLDFMEQYIVIPDIGIMVIVFSRGLGDLGSFAGRVLPKTQKGTCCYLA